MPEIWVKLACYRRASGTLHARPGGTRRTRAKLRRLTLRTRSASATRSQTMLGCWYCWGIGIVGVLVLLGLGPWHCRIYDFLQCNRLAHHSDPSIGRSLLQWINYVLQKCIRSNHKIVLPWHFSEITVKYEISVFKVKSEMNIPR